ncbi:prohead protease/major capsid protein fusion protein [Shinella sp. S4-D37]|uniref:prohead protease/major capsid protein fusion protein n=1 Tax=Shinella sp. S4-D37 TaxID=3161999 RepID=UPI0034655507
MTDQNGVLTRAAPLRASTWDAEKYTVQAVLSTGAAVTRYDSRGEFQEVLDLNQTWPASIPLLDSHSRGSVDDRLGEVVDIRTVNGEVVGLVKLSRHNERAKRVAAELSDGATYAVSIGYSVTKWAESKPGGKRTLTAQTLELLEASLTTVPADRGAGLRSEPMTTQTTETTTTQTRAELAAEVRAIAAKTGLPQDWVNAQTDADEIDLNSVRAAALAAMQARTIVTATVRAPHNETTIDNPEVRVRAAGEALYARTNRGHELSEQARAFVGMGTVDLARESLRHAGIVTTGMSASAIVERALHSASDFSLILGDSVGRTLRAGYNAAPSGLKRVGRQTTAKDFKDKHRLQLSEAPRLEKVGESGEFKSGTLTEAKESYRLATYGKMFGITRQAIINDDLGAFNDLARRMGQAAAATEAQLLVDLWLANSGAGPTMSDGKAVWHADHKNLQTAAAFDIAPLSIMRTAMRKQVGLTGELIAIEPKFLIIPADLETTAEQKLRTVLYPAASANAAPESMRSLEIVVEPRFVSATGYYLAADPASVDGLEYAYLEGEEGVQVETRAGWEVDGVQIKARTDFGAGFIDWRAFQRNVGA